MDKQEIENKVRKIIHEQLDVRMDEIKLESKLESFGLDSLDVVELLLAFEETFEIDIPDDDMTEEITVKDIVDYIEKHLYV